MTQINPFQQSMTRLQLPLDMGTCISVSGFTFEADEDRCVDVPKHIVPELMAHGLRPHVAPEQPVGKKR